MKHKVKVLGLMLGAIFALSAMGASAAQAAPEFTGFETPSGTHVHTLFSGEQSTTHEFTAGEGFGGITCTTAKFVEGTSATGASTTAEIHPEYSGCKDSLGRTADVSTTGCNYLFHLTSKVAADEYQGTADVVCGANPISVKVTSGSGTVVCTVTIGSQTGVGPIDFRNMTESSPTDVTVEATANNVKNTTSGGLLNCGVGNGEHTSGTYTGNTTVKGFDTENHQIDVEVSGE